MSQNYERLPIIDFGWKLLETNDLDPIYVALVESKITGDQLARWLLSYWCFYHAGVACYMSELEDKYDFWTLMSIAAENLPGDAPCVRVSRLPPVPGDPRWPRGKERRHFRGALATSSVNQMYGTSAPYIVLNMADPTRVHTFKEVSKEVQKIRGFGPWIAFKVADMLERVCGVSIDFEDSEVMMFSEPKKAALLAWETSGAAKNYPTGTTFKEDGIIKAVVAELLKEFGDQPAPPIPNRNVNIQEVETILCKWKSHINGHYPVGNDIHEITEGLTPWLPVCKTARIFNAAMPRGVL